jgi:protein-tyrosine-phosphatase
MFEHLLRKICENVGEEVVVESAGGLKEAAGLDAEEGAVIALSGEGIDISTHKSRWMGDLQFSDFSTIYCMDPGVMPLVQAQMADQGNTETKVILVNAPNGIPNPYGKDQEAYNIALQDTKRAVRMVVRSLMSD